MQGEPLVAPGGGEGDSQLQQHGSPRQAQQQQQQQQQQNAAAGLMGIAHRHDEALAHNPTPSETLLVERKANDQLDGSLDGTAAAAAACTGTLGAAPSPLLRDSGGQQLQQQAAASSSSMPPAILFPQTLFGEAAEPARAAPQSVSSLQGTPRKTYGGGGGSGGAQRISNQPASDSIRGGHTDVVGGGHRSTPSSPDTDTSATSRSRRKRVNSDGSNSSTLVEMLMRSSPSRLQPRLGTNEYQHTDDSVLHVVTGGDEEAGGDDSSDAESVGERVAATSSKYDYDTSWNMVGNRANMIGGTARGSAEIEEVAAAAATANDLSQPPGVLGAAVAASAAIAATVHSSDGSHQASEGQKVVDPRARPITPTELGTSSAADDASGTNHMTPLSTASAGQITGQPQQRHAQPIHQSQQSPAPSSPIHLVPRRRTRSTPNAGTCYVAASPPIASATRKRRDYAYQKYSTGDLHSADSVDMDDDFEEVRNIDSSGPREAAVTGLANANDVSDNPFDDFDCTPVGAPSQDNDVSAGQRAGHSRGDESVRSASSSSSSSITHRRRRGHVGPGTTIYGGQSSQSVSSFSGSMSTATTSVQPGQGPIGRNVPSENGSSHTNTDGSDETNRAARSLRASLDAGMAAMRRWARSHAGVAGSAAASAAQAGGRGPVRSSRAATMQLGEEDLFALVNAGADPRRSTSALEEEANLHSIYGLGGLSVFAPIAEEDEGAAAGRNRAFSEPDRARVRNFFSRRGLPNRGSPIQRANSRPSRTSTSGSTSQSDRRRSGQSTNPTSAAQFGNSVLSHMSSTDITASARALSSAAMSSSLFHSASLPPQTGVGGGRTFDAIDLLERGGAPVSSPAEEVRESSSRQVVEEDNALDGIAAINEGDPDANEEARRQQAATERQARRRWIRVNQKFQVLITFVALLFSLILFAVLVCWIVMTSSYVVSIDKACDVPLKKYFWLATLQLVFDVFRTDIMRLALRWDPNSGQRVPARVILYNVAYFIYAICVLRIGVKSVYFSPESTCSDTAPEFFSSTAAFVSLSLAAWSTIVVGYLFPFCFVAIILTRNGYSPSSDLNGEDAMNAAGIPGVFPNAYANAGAPPECIDRLQVIMLHEFPDDYPRECCICMSDFSAGEVIVVTNCEHVFHKRCCQEWLQQSRTCPVCRTDIPHALGMSEHGSEGDESVDGESRSRPNRPPLNREEFHQEVVSLLRILRQHEERLRDRISQQDREDEGEHMSAASDNISLPRSFGGADDIEENRMESEEVQSMPNAR